MIACCLVLGPLAGALIGGMIAVGFNAVLPGILAGACMGLASGIALIVYFSHRLANAQDQRGGGGLSREGSEGGTPSEGGSFLYLQDGDGGGSDGGDGDGGGD